MGRWAQAQRAGGGQRNPTALIHITLAEKEDTDATLTYSAPVAESDFDTTDFSSFPSAQIAIDVNPLGAPNILRVTFTDPIDNDDNIFYNGDVAGVETPQSVSYD